MDRTQKDVTDLNAKGRIDWSSYRTVLPSEDGKYLHMVYTDYDDYITKKTPDRLFNPRYGRIVDNEWKYNLHYVKINLQNHEVVNADGKVLKTPIDIDYSMGALPHMEHELAWCRDSACHRAGAKKLRAHLPSHSIRL